jgi:integrase
MRQAKRMSRKTKGWSYSAGERGKNRVRVYERPGYGIWIDYQDSTGKRSRERLNVDDRNEAKVKADEIAAKFRREPKRQAVELTLAGLFDIYEREVTPTKGKTSRGHDARAMEMFLREFGRDTKPSSLSRREWDRYVMRRTTGALAPKDAETGHKVRPRAVQQDLRLLLAILNWATRASDGKGAVLLDRNPLQGLKPPKDESPKRAVVSDSQYESLTAAAAKQSPQTALLLALVAETGHRIASVRQLRWSDIDLDSGRVRWRAENDKIGLEHRTPLTEQAVTALKAAQARTLSIGDAWVFPSTRKSSACLSEHGANHIFQRLAKVVELPTGERYGWHSLRRRFATSLRGGDPKTILALGGWKSWATVVTCYQVSDDESQRALLSSRLPVAGSALNAGKRVQVAQ